MKIDYSKFDEKFGGVISEAYKQGNKAYPIFGICQNPYRKGSEEASQWECGWCDAEGYADYQVGAIK